MTARAFKMSKSRGNVINPDDVVHRFGADSLRLYEMFMGPLRDTKVGRCPAIPLHLRTSASVSGVVQPFHCLTNHQWGCSLGHAVRLCTSNDRVKAVATQCQSPLLQQLTRCWVSPVPQVWSTNGVEGVHRFLARAWRLFEGGLSDGAPSAEQLRQLHSTIKRVGPLTQKCSKPAGWLKRSSPAGSVLAAVLA